MPKAGWPFAAALVWLSAWSGGCTPAVSQQGMKLCDNALASFNKGDYQATIRDMDAFLKEYGETHLAGRAYYLRGQARYRLNDHQGAKADFEKALDRTRDSDVRANASTGLGDVAWEAGDMPLAERMYRQALAYCERDVPPADHAYYRLGCVLQRLGRWQEADPQFNRVIHSFPKTPFAQRAERRVHARRWTIQAGAFQDRKLAEAAAEALRRENLPAAARPEPAAAEPLFVVEVGRYGTYDQAAAASPNVQRHQKDAFITVTR